MTQPACAPDEEPPPPVDDPFLERLFGVMCEHIPARREDTFVDRVRRWYETLRFMAELHPRTSAECLMAADVSMKNQFVLETLERGRDAKGRQRLMRSREFIDRARDLHEAQLQYDLLRNRPTH